VSDLLVSNLLSPVVLAFVLGIVARLSGSDLRLPRDIYSALSIYLLFAIGLKGGHELARTQAAEVAVPALATIGIGIVTPMAAYLVLRRLGRFDVANAAGIAAHYGSVSAVTFLAAQSFCASAGAPVEGFMPTLLTLLESPGIAVALAIGATQAGASRPLATVVHEILTGRSMVLLVGGLVVGALAGDAGWQAVAPFFESGFRGALVLFLLEMGIVTAERFSDLRRVGAFLLGFGIGFPVVTGAIAVFIGVAAGLSPGGATVLAAMAASASYIAAPPAVRLSLPSANPTYSLTAALAITFPFNVAFGIPLYFQIAKSIGGAA
jgi:hypothetical protein